jgi:hypothetical protein
VLITIPRTAPRGARRSYARLILRPARSRSLHFFEGCFLRPGAAVEYAALWPTHHYPVTPLVVEYAGSTGLDARNRPARGHNRARDLYILWRFNLVSREWEEIARAISEGPEWYEYFRPIVDREIIRRPVDHVAEARAAAGRLAALIDGELNQLADEGRERALSFLYDEIAMRFSAAIAPAPAQRAALIGGEARARRAHAA